MWPFSRRPAANGGKAARNAREEVQRQAEKTQVNRERIGEVEEAARRALARRHGKDFAAEVERVLRGW